MRLENRQQLDFDGLFRSEYPDIVREAHLMVGDGDVARDVAHEAFLRLLLQWRRLARHEPVSWVRHSAIRLATRWGHARRAHRRTLHLLEQHIDDSSPPALSDDALRRAVLSLPGPQRAAVVLHDIEERTLVEVADALSRSESRARTELERGRERLRRSVGLHGLLDEGHVLRLRKVAVAPIDVEERLAQVRRAGRRRRRTSRAGLAMMAAVAVAVAVALTLNVWEPVEVWDSDIPPDPAALGLPDRLETEFPLVAAKELPDLGEDTGRAAGTLYRDARGTVLVVQLAGLHAPRFPDPVARFVGDDAVRVQTPGGMDVWSGEVVMGDGAWPAVAAPSGDTGLDLIVGRDRSAEALVDLADTLLGETASMVGGWFKIAEADVTRSFLGRPPSHIEGCSATYSHPDGRQVYTVFWRDGGHVDLIQRWIGDPAIVQAVHGKPAVAGSTPAAPFHSSVTWKASADTTATVRITDLSEVPLHDTLELAHRLDRHVDEHGGSCLN